MGKELTDLNNSPLDNVEIVPQDDGVQWHVKIKVAEDCPYNGGTFVLKLDFSDNYPFKCPKVNFVTKVYHPGVNADTGEFCMQKLESDWKPTLNAIYIINHVKALLLADEAENA